MPIPPGYIDEDDNLVCPDCNGTGVLHDDESEFDPKRVEIESKKRICNNCEGRGWV